MGTAPARVVFSPYVQNLIKHKARQVCRKTGFARSDQEDLEQELKLGLLGKVHLYDPARGASFDTFADRVVVSLVKMILRERYALKRGGRRSDLSLDETIATTDKGTRITRGETLSEADRDRRIGGSARAPLEEDETREAVRHALSTLPPFMAEVARMLQRGSIAEVAHDLGIPRSRVYAAIALIRVRLEEEGFCAQGGQRGR